jgi:hypothetical protein
MEGNQRAIVMTLLLCLIVGAWLLSAVVYVIMGRETIPGVVIINNAGKPIKVASEHMSITLLPGNSGTIDDNTFYNKPFSVSIGNIEVSKYKWLPPQSRTFVAHNHFFLQIESDKKVFILDRAATDPVKVLLQQPDGYPLSPQ